MKTYRKARVQWLTDEYLDDRFSSPLQASVFFNGSVAAINVPRPGGKSDERVDRLVDATLTEKADGTVEIEGRSEYLEMVGLLADDQKVKISIEGGKCLTC